MIERTHKVFRRRDGERGWSLIETLAAIIIVGIGIALFTRTQIMTRSSSKFNSNLLKAGQLIEASLDSIRTFIARDTTGNWNAFSNSGACNPSPTSATVGSITLTRTVSVATSPKDVAVTVDRVCRLTLTASWGTGPQDNLSVTTYVAKRF